MEKHISCSPLNFQPWCISGFDGRTGWLGVRSNDGDKRRRGGGYEVGVAIVRHCYEASKNPLGRHQCFGHGIHSMDTLTGGRKFGFTSFTFDRSSFILQSVRFYKVTIDIKFATLVDLLILSMPMDFFRFFWVSYFCDNQVRFKDNNNINNSKDNIITLAAKQKSEFCQNPFGPLTAFLKRKRTISRNNLFNWKHKLVIISPNQNKQIKDK